MRRVGLLASLEHGLVRVGKLCHVLCTFFNNSPAYACVDHCERASKEISALIDCAGLQPIHRVRYQ